MVGEWLAGPQSAQDVETFVEQLAAHDPVGLFTERVVAGVGCAHADTDGHPPVRQPVDRGDLTGELPRLATRQRGQHRAQSQSRRAARGDRKRHPGVDAPHRLPHEETVPTVQLGNGRQFADFCGVSPRHYEAELHR